MQSSEPVGLKLLFRVIIGVVFVGMNLLYVLFWRNGARDYFDSLPESAKKLVLEAKEEYTPQADRPRRCHCGYDLREDPDRWMKSNGDEPNRCPQCFREVLGNEVDVLKKPQVEKADRKDFQNVEDVAAAESDLMNSPVVVPSAPVSLASTTRQTSAARIENAIGL